MGMCDGRTFGAAHIRSDEAWDEQQKLAPPQGK